MATDKEFLAVRAIEKALSKLPQGAQARVLRTVTERAEESKGSEAQPVGAGG